MAAVFTLTEILGYHVYSKVTEITTHNVDKITGMILECEKSKILEMLENKHIMMVYVERALDTLSRFSGEEDNKHCECNVRESNREYLAEELYNKILPLVNNDLLTAQITGILLDLDVTSISALLKYPNKLEKAIEKVKLVLSENKSAEMTFEESTADQIYCRVEEQYPQYAPQITGMLLEMGQDKLQKLLRTDTSLDYYIKQAWKVLSKNT